MNEITKEAAVFLFEMEFWEDMDLRERAIFQLYTPRLCMPFGVFHEAVESLLGRPVWSHEFANGELLRQEFRGEKEAPSIEEILEMIPEPQRLLIGL